MTALSHTPQYPAPQRQTQVTFSLTEDGSDFVRVWCTIAPTGSELDGKINSSKDPRNRVQIFEGTPAQSWSYNFDKGGKYTFVAQEYTKGSGYGGGYEGDPNGAANEEKVGTESTLTLFVGQRVTQPIGPVDNRATLVLWVWDNTIRATNKAVQGETSPSIIAQSPTALVKTAIGSTSLTAALAALVDTNCDVATGDLGAFGHNLYNAVGYHYVSTSHSDDDTDNLIGPSYDSPPTAQAFQELVNTALKSLRQHVTNDTGSATGDGHIGPGTGNYHFDGLSDRLNVPLYQQVSSLGEAYGAFVDIARCLDAHQNNLAVHDELDVYTLTTRTKLMDIHYAFLSVLASLTPSVPAAQSSGVQTLLSTAGFKEE